MSQTPPTSLPSSTSSVELEQLRWTDEILATGLAAPRPKYWIHEPTPPQEAFLQLPHLEALYGGAASGGKSDALLMAALQYVHVPGYAALLLRRTFQDLAKPGALMDRAETWLRGTDAHWDGLNKTWRFPSNATISFGYMDHEADKFQYQGAEYQFIGPDELTQFSESMYRYLFSRLRRLKGAAMPIRMRAARNPGGAGHEWVKRRFIDDATREGRVFIPAKLDDNPHVDREEYERSLDQLDPVTREQLRNGNWEAKVGPGLLFQRGWIKNFLDACPTDIVQWVRYWDFAATEEKKLNDPDWTVGLLMGRYKSAPRYVVADAVRFKKDPGDVEAAVKATAEMDRALFKRKVVVRWGLDPGQAGKSQASAYVQKLSGMDAEGIRETGSKVVRFGPFSAQCKAGNVDVVTGDWNTVVFQMWEAFPTKGVHDDDADAVSGAFNFLAPTNREGERLRKALAAFAK